MKLKLVPTFNLVMAAIFLSLPLPALLDGRMQPLPQLPSETNTGVIGACAFRRAGRFAIRCLTLSRAISPAVHLFGWRRLIPLRKWAGLWAFAFALLHTGFFFSDILWRKVWGQTFVYGGMAALAILAAMALTSHRPAMRLLGRNWKRRTAWFISPAYLWRCTASTDCSTGKMCPATISRCWRRVSPACRSRCCCFCGLGRYAAPWANC